MSERDASMEYWANWFWKRAGGRCGCPANIRYAVMCALEVYVEEVSGLTTSTASRISAGAYGIRDAMGSVERELHGCIVVNQRGAVILVEENDDEAQKRFTIAHEAAHYILEVKRHHDRAADRMGHEFASVLYGLRKATPTERIDAWLRDTRADALLHFMDRTPAGAHGCARTMEAECRADDLAIEVLAPRSELSRALLTFGRMGFSELLRAAARVAEERFGLPETIASSYASRIVWQMRGGPSTAERFGFGY